MAPEGAIRSIYYDADRPVRCGDVLKTTTGRCYLVVRVRKQQRGEHVGRYHLRCAVLGQPPPKNLRVHPMFWNERKPKRRHA